MRRAGELADFFVVEVVCCSDELCGVIAASIETLGDGAVLEQHVADGGHLIVSDLTESLAVDAMEVALMIP